MAKKKKKKVTKAVKVSQVNIEKPKTKKKVKSMAKSKKKKGGGKPDLIPGIITGGLKVKLSGVIVAGTLVHNAFDADAGGKGANPSSPYYYAKAEEYERIIPAYAERAKQNWVPLVAGLLLSIFGPRFNKRMSKSFLLL